MKPQFTETRSCGKLKIVPVVPDPDLQNRSPSYKKRTVGAIEMPILIYNEVIFSTVQEQCGKINKEHSHVMFGGLSYWVYKMYYGSVHPATKIFNHCF